MQEEKRRVSRISKYSKCLAEEEEKTMLQAYRYHTGQGERKHNADIHQVQSADHLPSTWQQPGPSVLSLCSWSSASSEFSLSFPHIASQEIPSHAISRTALPANNQTAHILQVMGNLCAFRYSGEFRMTVLMKTEIKIFRCIGSGASCP